MIKKKTLSEALTSAYTNIPLATRTTDGLMRSKDVCLMPQTVMGGQQEGLFILGDVPVNTRLSLIIISVGYINSVGSGATFLIRVHEDNNNKLIKANVTRIEGSNNVTMKVFLNGRTLAVSRRQNWDVISMISTLQFSKTIQTQNGTDGYMIIADM